MPKKQSTAGKKARAAARSGEKYTTALRDVEEPAGAISPDFWGFQPDYCANCDRPLNPGNRGLFCDDGCKDSASTIRWIRRHLASGTFTPAQVRYGLVRDENYAKALYNKLRFAVAGGYTRSTSPSERAAVVKRHGGRCVRCGAPGAEVDHIRGDGPEMSNRQLLCRACHDRKTQNQSREGMRLALQGKPTRSWRDLLRELVRTSESVRTLISHRILPQEPVRLCDTDQWQHLESCLRSERCSRLKNLLEDLFDGEVPRFAPRTPWVEKMDQARDYHSEMYDEVPCDIDKCPECSGKVWSTPSDWFDAEGYPSIEAWLDDPDVHARSGPGSYFDHAMAKDD
ncbi:HNH endonuclease signature motif containing protein [Streptomyces sp. NPDC001795]|uniref:HNH endonuclease n=1 Tax=Streptomyces sp. NPDC001795 TaxID=3154525 RepID=UPI003331A0F2